MFNFQPNDRLRRDRGATHLCTLGPRAIAEFIAEIPGLEMPAILDRLDAYLRISPARLRAVGGDRFPSSRPLIVPPDLGAAP